MKKKLTAALALLLVPLLFSACSEAPVTEEKETGTTAEALTEEEAPAEEEPEYSVTDTVNERYRDADLGGYEYKVLAPPNDGHFYAQVAAGINEVYAEELNGELINDAIFNRNLKAEDQLNMTVSPVWASGDTGGITSQVNKEVMAGVTDYDAVLNRMDYLGTSMQSGCLLNIRDIPTMDVSDPWWDENIVNAFTLFDKLYWISGDINIFDDFAVEVIFFNKRICGDIGEAAPYSDVLEGKWTLDRFYEMAKKAELDVDGDGKLNIAKDVVGHSENNDHIKHWIYAMGEKSLNIGADGSLELMVQTERQINVVNKLYSYMVENTMTYTGGADLFRQGHMLFLGDMLGPINSYREMEDDFGVVPMPKYDEQQERYGEYISNGWTTAYGIPMTNADPERTGMILDCLCGYSTDTLRVALYDVLFAAKLVRDTESTEMLNIIFDSKSYDWAVDFSWGGTFLSLYNNLYSSGTNNFVSTAEKSMKPMTKSLERLIQSIQELEY